MGLVLPEPYKFCNVSILGAHLSCSHDCLAGEKGQGEGNDDFGILALSLFLVMIKNCASGFACMVAS